ncbi:hypothetical protein [Nocardia grenadensis]|uniref:hypothetical protein n=1 Tax=Nocardia grenadensis TaxID=931537 RepID=UPI0007A3C3C8|nr:hypothetical protein [Nocardia grenadensis]
MHRTARTRRLAVRIAATAAIALAPLTLTAAPALADDHVSVVTDDTTEAQDVSRPGRHGHGYGDRGRHGRHDHSWNGRHNNPADWNRGRNRHDRGWDRGWDHGRHNNWDRGHHRPGFGLPFPRIFLPGTGSAF